MTILGPPDDTAEMNSSGRKSSTSLTGWGFADSESALEERE